MMSDLRVQRRKESHHEGHEAQEEKTKKSFVNIGVNSWINKY